MPVQHGEEITDPARIAALEASAKQWAESRRAAERLLTRCRRLSSEKLRAVLASVATQLAPVYQWDFLEDMAKRLPADALRQVEAELTARVAKKSTKAGQNGARRR